MKITKTEQLLFGPEGASDPRNPFRLERDLISSLKWKEMYDQMPVQCQNEVDKMDKPWDGCSVGIGRNDEVGWFILGCGQGPFVIWIER